MKLLSSIIAIAALATASPIDNAAKAHQEASTPVLKERLIQSIVPDPIGSTLPLLCSGIPPLPVGSNLPTVCDDKIPLPKRQPSASASVAPEVPVVHLPPFVSDLPIVGGGILRDRVKPRSFSSAVPDVDVH